MKTTNTSLPLLPILVIFLFSALAANLLLLDASAADAPPFFNPAVLDTDGDVVMAGQPYYIVPAIRGPAGGEFTVACPNKTGTPCPLDIVQLPSVSLLLGLPFSFSPVNKAWARFIVQESTDLNIISPAVTNCGIEYSTMWGLEYDESNSKNIVKTCAPADGDPGYTNWFQIKKSDIVLNSYKIVFCSNVGHNFNLVCEDIPISQQFGVVFIKAKPTITTVTAHYDK